MEHVYVFDYCTSSIYHFTVKNDEDIEEIMRDKGLRLDDCYYMSSESPIEILKNFKFILCFTSEEQIQNIDKIYEF